MLRRHFLPLLGATVAGQTAPGPRRLVRFRRSGVIRHGLLEGSSIRPLRGGLFDPPVFAGSPVDLNSVELLYPVVPPKVWAVGLNYRSHLDGRPAPKNPEIFLKPTTCLQHPGHPIVVPPESRDLHYEAELVIVMGRRLRNASREEAAAAIFGYTCGNDVSERWWQNGPEKDLQWWRAKGADTFGPLGPAVVTAEWKPERAAIRLRLNGEVRQEQKLADLIFDCPAVVQFISRYATIEPGDVIFTGTPGTTAAMKPGDVVEVEIDGIGVLRNPVRAA